MRIDGNDILAVHRAVSEAADRARAGHGPTLIEAVTYRIDAHTNADDDSRYRPEGEADAWAGLDPVDRLERRLLERGLLDEQTVAETAAEAAAFSAGLSARFATEPQADPREMFRHVYQYLPPHLREQAAQLDAELEAAGEGE
ncbi:hypothetical protein GCM10020000_76420 [Streptomyces olivoverticillatus]